MKEIKKFEIFNFVSLTDFNTSRVRNENVASNTHLKELKYVFSYHKMLFSNHISFSRYGLHRKSLLDLSIIRFYESFKCLLPKRAQTQSFFPSGGHPQVQVPDRGGKIAANGKSKSRGP